jgi:hypothetical protein
MPNGGPQLDGKNERFMIRDFDLIRSVLFQVEQAPAGEPLMSLQIDAGMDPAVLGEHLEIMIGQNLIEGEVISLKPLAFLIHRLTWQGHDFLEHARNDTIWKKVMAEAKSKGVSMTVVILNGLLSKAAEKYAGLE